MSELEKIKSVIWGEEAESEDAYVASKCILAGYDVYGDLLGKVSWIEYIFILFRQQAPTESQSNLLNDLAVAIACAGPRDLSTQAAMSAAAGGSTLASCLMASLAVGAGQSGGSREVFNALLAWQVCGKNLEAWQDFLAQPLQPTYDSIWPAPEHPAGFDPNAKICGKPIQQTLERLAASNVGEQRLKWLLIQRERLEEFVSMPLSLVGVSSCALADLGFDPQQGELLYLLLRLPGTAALALEQHWRGWRDYPSYQDKLSLTNDPNEAGR